MRDVEIFSGSSHPKLTEAICERLGATPAKSNLGKFSNGETRVEIGVSVRNKDVYIVQSGSHKINDSIMELLIMINACKGGSAKSVTAVMPYFPYSRQSKKKSHRGAITARMLANLLSVAGVDHIISCDLHASQMQGFFAQPVDNLFAEPLISRWIRLNVPNWRQGVVVSKNAGGSKRVTSLADTLKLNFGIVTTDRRRKNPYKHVTESAIFFDTLDVVDNDIDVNDELPSYMDSQKGEKKRKNMEDKKGSDETVRFNVPEVIEEEPATLPKEGEGEGEGREDTAEEDENAIEESSEAIPGSLTVTLPDLKPSCRRPSERYDWNDIRAREVITGRLVQGQLVDDDYPSPQLSSTSGVESPVDDIDGGLMGSDPMASSIASYAQPEHALGGSYDAADASSDDEEDKLQGTIPERTITLVGDVKDRTVFIIDDMIDTSQSWIAAAETVVKRGGAKKVYCIASHGLFGENCLKEMHACDSIDKIVVTNTFPLPNGCTRKWKKLVVIDSAALLSEGIRRHHYGESLSGLFSMHD